MSQPPSSFKQDTPQEAQFILKDAYQKKSNTFHSFFDSYASEYKLLKKITHECQTKCYSNEIFSIKDAESCARQCLRPYLTFKKITGDRLQICEEQYQKGESRCIQEEVDKAECYLHLNEKLYGCLKQHGSFYQKTYKNIFNDFDKIVEY